MYDRISERVVRDGCLFIMGGNIKIGKHAILWYTGEDRIEIDKIPRNLILSKAK